ncbi:GNAT family N-acetyltransferase [Acetivibrio cellulolyticus]|uniref:GNAT family N-acetyltransferase n=1 Tax=Acetivibrio cellulolyticus TaxID=35830 RepID=UPI0001E2E7E2|nr:GNAT family N-acetyltransferase [Acetivibrio cellulolyticus]
MVKQADECDIPIIEEILLDAVNWMSNNGLQNQWNESNVKWSSLSKSYRINNFYIAYQNGLPSACMALTDYDPTYWPNIPKGESLYLHKFAVKRTFAGKGLSKELIDFAKKLACSYCITAIRLNCNQHRNKLRAVYEKEGFICVEEKTFFERHDTALYICIVNDLNPVV